MRYGMVIDLDRCTGCHSCAMACKAQNGSPHGVWWSKVLQSEVGTYPDSCIVYTPVLCMHCENAPCVEVCPVGATWKDENGIVVQDESTCIGCQSCISVCPYDARTYVETIEAVAPEYGFNPYEEMMYKKHLDGKVEKCDFCRQLLKDGEETACVRTCIAYARHFGDLDDPESEVSKLLAENEDAFTLLPEEGTQPSVYYLPKRHMMPADA